MSWTRVMDMSKEDIKKKIGWYKKQQEQKELDEFAKESEKKKVKLAFDGVKLKQSD